MKKAIIGLKQIRFMRVWISDFLMTRLFYSSKQLKSNSTWIYILDTSKTKYFIVVNNYSQGNLK